MDWDAANPWIRD